jgi:hypothetical protein
MTFVTGLIGVLMVVTFLGFLAWWIRELPFTLIVLAVVGLMVYDVVRTLRYGDNGPGR